MVFELIFLESGALLTSKKWNGSGVVSESLRVVLLKVSVTPSSGASEPMVTVVVVTVSNKLLAT